MGKAIFDRKSRKYEGDKLGRLRTFKQFLLLAVLYVCLFRFLIGISLVSGNSMYPTVKSGQLVVFSRLERNYHRGDIVALRMPSGEKLIKRVIAVGGDTLEIRDGIVYVNGKEERGSYVQGETTVPDEIIGKAEYYSISIEEGTVFVMGDNREFSVDSRNAGPISESQLKGKIIQFGK